VAVTPSANQQHQNLQQQLECSVNQLRQGSSQHQYPAPFQTSNSHQPSVPHYPPPGGVVGGQQFVSPTAPQSLTTQHQHNTGVTPVTNPTTTPTVPNTCVESVRQHEQQEGAHHQPPQRHPLDTHFANLQI